MMPCNVRALLVAVSAGVVAVGCVDEAVPLDQSSQALDYKVRESLNGLVPWSGEGGLWTAGTWNALNWSDEVWDDFRYSALRGHRIPEEIVAALDDETMMPDGRRRRQHVDAFLGYVVGCALAGKEGDRLADTVTIETPAGFLYRYEGNVGVAREWASPRTTMRLTPTPHMQQEEPGCDDECHKWVSACLGAHINSYGWNVMISMAATDNDGLGIRPEPLRAEYAFEEGAYYGRALQATSELYSCTGVDMAEADVAPWVPTDGSLMSVMQSYASVRICGTEHADRCNVTHVGRCDRAGSFDFCAAADDGYDSCRDSLLLGGEIFPEAITVFLDNGLPTTEQRKH